jgi:predicted O-linked N-acetylglucosamine transferase (SPINDLY family)
MSMSLVSRSPAKPFDVHGTFQQALAYHHQGRTTEAEPLYAAVLNVRPDHFDALQMLGIIKLGRGDFPTALRLTAAAMQQRPDSPQALLNHGLVLNAMERHEEALASFDRALKRKAKFAEALNNRGSALTSLGRAEEAVESLKRALAAKPDYPEAHYNLGNALRKLDRHEEALKSYDRALLKRPNYAKAHCNRGSTLEDLERYSEALAAFDRAILILPNFGEALLNRCTTLRGLNRPDDAMAGLERLIETNPEYAEAHYTRGILLADSNKPTEAVASYERAAALKPDHAEARWGSCIGTLPILYKEEAEIALRRGDYSRRLQALRADVEAGRMAADLSKNPGRAQPFYLAYQGYNDRELQKVYGELVAGIMAKRYGTAELSPPPGPDEPLRVGIVSGFFRQHSVWKVAIKGWVGQMDSRRFQIFGYHTGAKQDAETEFARAHCHKFVQGPHKTERWREIILADRPHVLMYPEISMHPEAAELAMLRLAPVQCSSIGHPQTSGLPTIDYFLSGELIEPADGEQHYTEKLVKLPNIAFHYEPLQLPSVAVSREELGLRASSTAYWCAQSLFKYLPQHDEVFPRIAREAGDCQFVFIRHGGHNVTEVIQQRLDRAFAACGMKAEDHCVFLPYMDVARFASASGQCDVMLDSIGWSGGNTTLEALAQDLPVVTFEGGLMRGRVSAGILRMMGMPETIAETIDDYVALAVRMAKDPDWRRDVKNGVVAKRDRLYRDRTSIAAIENFLDRAARRPE